MKILQYTLDLFFDAFKWFMGLATLILFSPLLIIIAIPIVVILIFAFSIFITILLSFIAIVLKLALYIGIPAIIIYYILQHFKLI